MGSLRHHKDKHEQFQMREDLISIGDDYWIENDSGDRVYKVDGKVARLRDTWKLKNRDGDVVAVIREKVLSIRDAITIEASGRDAKVKKALVGIRDRFHVEVEHGDDLKVHGNVVDHEYEIERDGHKVAEVSKKWFRVRDTYGVEVYDPTITPLILAITVAVDALSNDRR